MTLGALLSARRKSGWQCANADRGGSLARRRIRSSKRVCPCVLSLRQKSEIPVSAPRIRSRTYRSRGRGQGLAEREHLSRTLRVSESLQRRKETNGDRGGVPPRAPMFETRPTFAQVKRVSSARSGARTESGGRRLGPRSRSRVTAGSAKVGSAIQVQAHAWLRDHGERAGIATEASEGEDRHETGK